MRLAIIGAGISGMAAAYGLRTSAVVSKIDVFEKSRGLGGRAATRRKNGCCYDHGANYFYSDDPEIRDIILNRLPTDELVAIEKPIYVFDLHGKLMPGDEERDRSEKWVYQSGISKLAKLLAAEVPSDRMNVRVEQRIASLERTGTQWTLISTTGERFGGYDRVLCTIPAPQAVDLFKNSDVSSWGSAADAGRNVRDALGHAKYGSQLTFILGFPTVLTPQPFYAAVNTDRQNSIAWLSFENDKRGHVAEAQTVLIVQMAPHWSLPRYDLALEQLLPDVLASLTSVLGQEYSSPSWTDIQKWRFALPQTGSQLSEESWGSARKHGLYFAGDYTAGKGRVSIALKSGLVVANEIQEDSKTAELPPH